MSFFNVFTYDYANSSKPTKEKCVYYNRTQKKIFTNVAEGIPENLILNFLGWLMLISLFACLRKKAWNYGRLALVQKNEERWTQLFYGTLDDVVGATEVNSASSLDSSVHIDRGFCSWLLAIFKIKDENIMAKSGYDAVQYLSFQRHIIVLVAVICFISLTVVLPINFQGDLEGDEKMFGHTTVSNLDPSSPLLWVHVTIAILYLPLGIYIMRRFSVNLKFEDRDTVSRTLMISNIPRVACDADDLHRHFREAYPEFEVQGIQLAYNITKVSELDKQREKAYQAKIYCDNYLKDTGVRLEMRPYICGNICSCCEMFGCATVDAIDFYTEEESRLQVQVDAERSNALKRPLGIVFVTLVSLAAAKKVYSDHQHTCKCGVASPASSVSRRLEPHKWHVQFAPSPRDICWEDLSVSRHNFYWKAILVNVLLFICLFFLTTPAIFVNLIDTIKIPDQIEKMSPILSEFLPTLLLLTVAALLPVIVSHSDEWLSHWTRSQRNHSIMRKTFIFLLFMVLILPALGLTSQQITEYNLSKINRAAEVAAFLNKYQTAYVALFLACGMVAAAHEPLLTKKLTSAQAFVEFAFHASNETYRWECLFMPDKGAFFVNYVITSAFIGTSLELIRFPELFVYTLRLCLARSKAETVSLRNTILWEYPFGVHYAWMLLIFAMTTVLSLSCPLITPFGLLYMLMKHCVDRYNLYFAYGPSKISQRIHATAINFVIVSIILLQASFMSLSLLRRGFNSISIYSLTGFILTIIVAFLHNFLRYCGTFSPIYHQQQSVSITGSPSINSPRHNNLRYQFVPDVLQRGPISPDMQTTPRQPDLVTVYSPTDGLAALQRTYGTDQSDHTFQPAPSTDHTTLYQNYDTTNSEA